MAYEYTRTNNLWETEVTLVKYETVLDDNLVPKRTKVENTVFAQVGSLYQKEFFLADRSGLNGQWKVVIFAGDYAGESEVIYEGERYAVYRKYYDGEYLELFLRDDMGTDDDFT